MMYPESSQGVSRRERRAHEREKALADDLVGAAKYIGTQAVMDVHNGVRFAQMGDVDIAGGIFGELDQTERGVFKDVLKKARRIGPDGLSRAFSLYHVTIENIEQQELSLDVDQPRSLQTIE